jgi:hypothetical protein
VTLLSPPEANFKRFKGKPAASQGHRVSVAVQQGSIYNDRDLKQAGAGTCDIVIITGGNDCKEVPSPKILTQYTRMYWTSRNAYLYLRSCKDCVFHSCFVNHLLNAYTNGNSVSLINRRSSLIVDYRLSTFFGS